MAKATQRQKLNHSTGRTLAALLGTIPLAVGAGLVLTLLLPLGRSERFLIGGFSVFPLWTALSLIVFLAPSGKRAWLGLLGAVAVLGLLIVVGQLSGRGLALEVRP